MVPHTTNTHYICQQLDWKLSLSRRNNNSDIAYILTLTHKYILQSVFFLQKVGKLHLNETENLQPNLTQDLTNHESVKPGELCGIVCIMPAGLLILNKTDLLSRSCNRATSYTCWDNHGYKVRPYHYKIDVCI